MSLDIKKLKITCIVCPLGCEIEVVLKGKNVVDVKGFTCMRGKRYAVEEATAPKRTVISVVRCKNGDLPTVSVKSDRPVPKERIRDIMKYLSEIEVEAPVEIGDVIVENILDLGVNIVATRPCKRSS